MSVKIILRKKLSDQLFKIEIKPSGTFIPAAPGQYVILRMQPGGEAITLPVVKTDWSRETLTVIVSAVSEKISPLLNPCHSDIQIDMEGPYGQAFTTENFGSVLCVANFDNLIPLYPVLAALKAAGNQMTCLLAGTPDNDPFLENEIRLLANNWINNDGNPRRTTQLIEQTLRTQKYDQVFVIGPATTIRETCTVCTATKNPVQAMLFLNEKNQLGQHGIYRVSVCGNARALCVDGYNFNAYYASFEEMVKRFGGSEAELQFQKKINMAI